MHSSLNICMIRFLIFRAHSDDTLACPPGIKNSAQSFVCEADTDFLERVFGLTLYSCNDKPIIVYYVYGLNNVVVTFKVLLTIVHYLRAVGELVMNHRSRGHRPKL